MRKRIGNYELVSKLGKGTFGTVYLGIHVPSHNKIAIKMISRKSLKPEEQNRLEQEILCQRSVSSECIVSLIDVQKTENNFYLILEYCAGGDLSQFIKQHGPVNEETTQRWMRNLVDGFKALQTKGIIHRDLKLQNILMSESSEKAVLKLADFGMSRFLGDELAQTWLGTPLYMAPEMFRHKEGYDSKADIWSLGVVMFEMLTGKPPFKASKREEIPQAQQNLEKIPDNLSSNCRDLLEKLLTYEVKNRISFEELFSHPFIAREVSVSVTVIENLKKSDDEFIESPSEFEFEILDMNVPYSESGGFTVLKKDSHPSINLAEVISGFESEINTSSVIARLAHKLKTNNESISAFSLYSKAAYLLTKTLIRSKDIIDHYALTMNSYPAFFEATENLKKLALEIREKTDEVYKEIEVVVEDKKSLGVSEVRGKVQVLAEKIIFNYAISLCKEAAKDEYLRDYLRAGEGYKDAVLLMDHLAEEKNGTDSEWKVFEGFLIETRRRLETVYVKLATA